METQRNQRYRKFVDRFEEVARENLDKLSRVADLCRMAGVNERTLSRAFRLVRGTTPYRCLQQLRLSEVKRVLSSEEGTVTQAAIQHGFREFGRFAQQYRKAFGESPSETKRRAQSLRAASLSKRSVACQ
jgi:transcriptional regulator GlxA family with amidase domain